MFLFFDEHDSYQEYPENQSCKFQLVTILEQSMNPRLEVNGEEKKEQMQEETWKVE
jgi:hypothetical protein